MQASEKLTITEDTSRVQEMKVLLGRAQEESKELRQSIDYWKQLYVDFKAQVTMEMGLEVDNVRLKNSKAVCD